MGNMNPSTYQQVRENMEKLLDLMKVDPENPNTIPSIIERLEDLEKVVNNITDPDSGSGDLGQDENGNVYVYGITLITEFAEVNTAPASYKRDITYELKKPSAVSLKDTPGFEAEYVLIMTFTHNLREGESVDVFKYAGQQIAVGANAVLYTRTGVSDGSSWGEWVAVTPAGGGTTPVKKQWVAADTEPSDQETGDYWSKPIT